jgi:hypothetical protein
MKLDYLHDAGDRRSIVRLYDFTTDEALQFMKAIEALASEAEQQICVHSLPGISAVDGCKLSLVRKFWDQGILKTGPTEFECGFTSGTWDNIAGLIKPFADAADGHQFLSGSPGEAELLFSPSGNW